MAARKTARSDRPAIDVAAISAPFAVGNNQLSREEAAHRMVAVLKWLHGTDPALAALTEAHLAALIVAITERIGEPLPQQPPGYTAGLPSPDQSQWLFSLTLTSARRRGGRNGR